MKQIIAKVINLGKPVGISLAIVVSLAAAFQYLHAEPTADQLAKEAREMRIKAMKGHCNIIGQRVAECYSGNKKQCDALQDSLAWFTGEYGQTPEIACTVEDPLRFGGGHQ